MSRTDAAPTAPSAPPRRKLRRLLRLAAWNALFIIVGLALIVLGSEAYFRVTKPFMVQSLAHEFVPGVGLLLKPDAELRLTNLLDYWTISRSNRLGFLDREPPPGPPAGCPVAIIGDSFIEAREVPIADKVQVRLEEIAAAQLPHLNLTASAFGKSDTGQVGQLAYYDRYARDLSPRLLVLVFVDNDLWNNHPVVRSLYTGWDPQHLPLLNVARRPDGTLALRPPDPEYGKFNLPTPPRPRRPWVDRALADAGQISWFARWLKKKKEHSFPSHYWKTEAGQRAAALRQRPEYAAILEDAAIPSWDVERDLAEQFAGGRLWPIYAEALEYTAFALAQFRERAARDGAGLVILATHNLKVAGTTYLFDRIKEMAAAQGIPVIDQADYLRRQGAKLPDAHWRHDLHWNAQGHQWAAEALLEWIGENQQVCRPQPAAGPPFEEN